LGSRSREHFRSIEKRGQHDWIKKKAVKGDSYQLKKMVGKWGNRRTHLRNMQGKWPKEPMEEKKIYVLYGGQLIERRWWEVRGGNVRKGNRGGEEDSFLCSLHMDITKHPCKKNLQCGGCVLGKGVLVGVGGKGGWDG